MQLKIIRNFGSLIRDIKPIILSHHPSCERFENHTVTLFRKKICIGCLAFYPTLFISLILYIMFGDHISISSKDKIIYGSILTSTILISYLGITKSKISKFLIKVILALGVFFVFIGIYELAASQLLKILFLFIFAFILFVLNYVRIILMLSSCNNCESKNKSHYCRGFRKIYINLIKDGFIKAPNAKCPFCEDKIDLNYYLEEEKINCPSCNKEIFMP